MALAMALALALAMAMAMALAMVLALALAMAMAMALAMALAMPLALAMAMAMALAMALALAMAMAMALAMALALALAMALALALAMALAMALALAEKYDEPNEIRRRRSGMSEQMFGLGCSDGNCRIRDNKGGMHTNGGCKCLRYPEDIEKVKKLITIARQAENLLAYNEYAISDNAKHSAELLRQAIREVKDE